MKAKKLNNKLVSIIIPSRNEDQILSRLLFSIKKQSFPNTEIIVVDNNSQDATKAVAKKFTNQVYDHGPERSAQRNYGAKKANGVYLLFLDADMKLTHNNINECIKIFEENNQVGGVSIPEKSVAKTFWEKTKAYERSFYNQWDKYPTTDAARFFLKDTFLKIGGYDESITGPEDWDLTERILEKGFKILRIKSMIYHYERIPTLLTLIKKKFYYGLDAQRYMKKHKVAILGPKTIYFLRPVFYRNIDKIFSQPVLFLGMIIMLSSELLAGGLGYLIGRIKNS